LFHIDQIRKSYDDNAVLAIEEKCHFPKGSVISLLGHSGSGKSTFLNITGLLDTADEIILSYTNNENTFDYEVKMNELEMDSLRMKEFGFIFQSGHLLNHLNTIENIAFPLHLKGEDYKESLIFARKNAKALQLPEYTFKNYPDQLSGGEYHRAAVARAMIKNPSVIFADEPTGNLDPDIAKAVMGYLIKWKDSPSANEASRSLILVTHNFEHAYEYSDQIYLLHKGQLSPPIDGNRIRNDEIGHLGLFSIFTEYRERKSIDVDSLNSSNVKSTRINNSMEVNSNSLNLSKQPEKRNPPKWRWAAKELFPIRRGTEGGLRFFLNSKVKPCSSTIFNMLSIGMLLIACLIVGGVLYGAINAYNQWLNNDPLLTRIVASSTGGKINPYIVKKLKLMHYSDESYTIREENITALKISEENILEDLKQLSGKKYSTKKNLIKNLPESIKKSEYKERVIDLVERRDSPMIKDEQFLLPKSVIRNIKKDLSQEQIALLEEIADTGFDDKKDIEEHKNLSGLPKDLKQKISKSVIPDGKPINAKIHPFMGTDLIFFEKDESYNGRTVDINNPILKTLKDRFIKKRYGEFASNSLEGFIVKEDFLDELGLSHNSKYLKIKYEHIPLKRPILQVVSWLPDNAKYLVTEAFWLAYLNKQIPIPDYNKMIIGPLPAEKDQISILKEKLSPLFKNQECTANWDHTPKGKRKGKKYLLVNSGQKRYTKETFWDQLVSLIDLQLQKDPQIPWVYKKASCVNDGEAIKKRNPVDPDHLYFYVSVHLNTTKKIEPSIDYIKSAPVFQEIGLKPDETNLGNLNFVKSIEEFGLYILLFIFISLTTLTGVNVYMTFKHRVQQKQKEIGIMRAFGLSKKLLQKIYSLQALIIWFGALCFGLFGIPLGLFIGWFLKKMFFPVEIQEILRPKEYYFQAEWIQSAEFFIRSSLFTMTGSLGLFPGDFVIILLFFTLILCYFSTRIGISTILKTTPADLVRQK